MNIEKLHAEIYRLLDKEALTNPVSYRNFANAKGRPYQSYERIKFDGLRWSVEKRIREYGLEEFFNPDHIILDIGSNYGFFVNEFAIHCKAAHGIEPTDELNKVGEIVANYLGVSEKVKFYPCGFEDFKPDVQYDAVLTLASFFTSDKRQRSKATDFFGKIYKILRKDGWLFYESTSYQKEPEQEDYSHYPQALMAKDAIEELFGNLTSWETKSGPENYRLFVKAQKI